MKKKQYKIPDPKCLNEPPDVDLSNNWRGYAMPKSTKKMLDDWKRQNAILEKFFKDNKLI